MSYTKDVGEVSARYRPGGEVPSVTYPSGTHVVFTAPGSATNGQYGLFEWNMTGTRSGSRCGPATTSTRPDAGPAGGMSDGGWVSRGRATEDVADGAGEG